MPHCTVEYSGNLERDGDFEGLLRVIADHFSAAPELFPIVGIRVRAIRVTHYVIADGAADNAFVHIGCAIAAGRSSATNGKFFGDLFEVVKGHFRALAERRPIGLSLDVREIAPETYYRFQTIDAASGIAR